MIKACILIDGKLFEQDYTDLKQFEDCEIYAIDGRDGYTRNMQDLSYVLDVAQENDVVIVTNSLEAWCHNDTKLVEISAKSKHYGEVMNHYIMIRNKVYNIQTLTPRSIRAPHSLDRLYISGAFSWTPKEIEKLFKKIL